MSAIDYALGYAKLGVPVFPCRDKRPLTPHGFYDATTAAGAIRGWWGRWPDAQIAAPTGLTYDVVDIDSLDALHALEDALGRLSEVFDDALGIVKTPRGWHYLLPPTGRGNRANVLVHGVDYRGRGGYTVLPGSDGYRWIERPTFAEATA